MGYRSKHQSRLGGTGLGVGRCNFLRGISMHFLPSMNPTFHVCASLYTHLKGYDI